MKTNENNSILSSGSSSFVRKYLTGIFLIICLILLSIFWGFSYKASSLIKNQLHQQGVAFFQEVVLTREWAANHGGVYVKLGSDVKINPYLLKIPGLKVVITDREGECYTLKNPALITREISELAVRKGLFKFKITSLKPLNPDNSPDQFERKALTRFDHGLKEWSTYEDQGNEVLYRYMAPLVTYKSCLKCHSAQGYREGDIRGGISVTINATDMINQLHENNLFLLISAIGIVALIFAIIRFISQAFIKELKLAEQKLIEMASRDFLTGLLNRREMYNRLASEVSRAGRNDKPLSVIMIDIDFFKKLNDTYGHSMGDTVLKELSCKLQETLRKYDIICRYGGEEFLVVAPDATSDEARNLAERIRSIAQKIVIPYGSNATPVSISISAGVSQYIEGEDVEKTISRADAALYRAKGAGRNRVEVA
ncbi:MAG: diguanylate cyclase [Geobacteraceae bacterium]|nr:diguanylate cyclase [Geobacteraceae bacterium]